MRAPLFLFVFVPRLCIFVWCLVGCVPVVFVVSLRSFLFAPWSLRMCVVWRGGFVAWRLCCREALHISRFLRVVGLCIGMP